MTREAAGEVAGPSDVGHVREHYGRRVHVRDAVPADADLLLELLLEAYNWTGEIRVTREAMLADPHARRYLDGWMRPGDFGVVAVDEAAGDPAAPLGAVWARALTGDEPGYGYVADDVPELGMAVVPGRRGAGVGAALLAAFLDRARAAGVRVVSLSVEDGNVRARSLYERHGFAVVGRTGGSDTMLLVLGDGAENAAEDDIAEDVAEDVAEDAAGTGAPSAR